MKLKDLYEMIDADEACDALDEILGGIDELCASGDFHRIDEILEEVDLDKLDGTLMIGFLVATKPAKDNLDNRELFVTRVEERLPASRSDKLLENLR